MNQHRDVSQTWLRVADHFRFKPRIFCTAQTMIFNGSALDQPNARTMLMRQPIKLKKHRYPSNQMEFTNQHAMAQYIGVNIRP